MLPGPRYTSLASQGVGGVLIVIGLLLLVFANGLFTRAGTNVIPFQEATALVTDGVYRRTRNPMYLGMLLVLLGAIVGGQVVGLTFLVLSGRLTGPKLEMIAKVMQGESPGQAEPAAPVDIDGQPLVTTPVMAPGPVSDEQLQVNQRDVELMGDIIARLEAEAKAHLAEIRRREQELQKEIPLIQV